MIPDADDTLDGFAIAQKHFLPSFNVAGAVFGGLRTLLDDPGGAGEAAGGARPAAQVPSAAADPATSLAALAEADTGLR